MATKAKTVGNASLAEAIAAANVKHREIKKLGKKAPLDDQFIWGRTAGDARMHAAFTFVQDKKHWKNPIDITLDPLDESQIELVTDAVIHYTGSCPHFVLNKSTGKMRITAVGYYVAIGA
jgi:hypothetical protein